MSEAVSDGMRAAAARAVRVQQKPIRSPHRRLPCPLQRCHFRQQRTAITPAQHADRLQQLVQFLALHVRLLARVGACVHYHAIGTCLMEMKPHSYVSQTEPPHYVLQNIALRDSITSE